MAKPRPEQKYTFAEVQLVRQLAKAGVEYKEIQKVVPMPAGYISAIKSGRIRVTQ